MTDWPKTKEECEAAGLQWVVQGKDLRSAYCRKKTVKSPIEYFWESPFAKYDHSVKYQKIFKKEADQNPEVVDALTKM